MPLTEEEIRKLDQVIANESRDPNDGLPGFEAAESVSTSVSGAPAPPPTHKGYTPSFPYDPNAFLPGPLTPSNAARLLGNVPASGARVARDILGAVTPQGYGLDVGFMGMPSFLPGSAVVNPMMDVAVGGVQAGGQLLGLNRETEKSKMFKDFVSSIVSEYSSPGKKMVEDPVGFFLDVSGLAQPALKLLGIAAKSTRVAVSMEKAAEFVEVLNPIGAGFRVAKGTVGKIPEWAKETHQALAGLTSGAPREIFEEIFQSYKKYGRGGGGVRKTLKTPINPVELKDKLARIVSQMRESRGSEYAAKKAALVLKDPANPIDLKKLQQEVVAALPEGVNPVFVRGEKTGALELTDLDFSRSGITHPHERQLVKDTVFDALRWDKITPEDIANETLFKEWQTTHGYTAGTRKFSPSGWNKNGIDEVDLLKKSIGDRLKWKSPETDLGRGKAFAKKAYHIVRNDLVSKVDGYKELVEPFEKASKFLEIIESTFSVNAKDPTSAFRKIIQAFSGSDAEFRRDLLRTIDEIAVNELGESAILPSAAAQLGRAPIAKGIMGPRGLILGGSLGGGYLLNRAFFLGLPHLSPRWMSEFYAALGYSAHRYQPIVNWMEKVHNAVPKGAVTRGMTYGAIAEKYLGKDFTGSGAEQDTVVTPVPEKEIRRRMGFSKQP